MSPPPIHRLSGTDALFLAMETPEWHQHVAGVTVLDPSTTEGFGFERFAGHLEERLPLAPKFRWKLRETPLNLHRPIWVEDDGFDLARHVHRIGVPAPGGPRELEDLVSHLMTRQLDRRHPLWEAWYVDGLADGLVAFVLKFHHCLMDGVSGAALTTVIMDLEPDPAPREPVEPVESPGTGPSDAELLLRSVVPNMRTPFRIGRYAVEAARRGLAVLDFNRKADVTPPLTGVPTTRWNREISARRAVAMTSVALADVKALKDVAGAKVNDVILAICSGALRDYLEHHGELPERPLVAGVPISTRNADDTDADNQIANMIVSLATDEADPLARLRSIAESSRASKAMTNAARAHHIQSIGETAPPLMLNLAIRGLAQSGVLHVMPTIMNTLVSNVPGPSFPLYLAGARVRAMFPGSVITETMGLNITVLSYMDRVDFGLSADPELIPDLREIADRIPTALAELLEAADLGDPSPCDDPFRPAEGPHR